MNNLRVVSMTFLAMMVTCVGRAEETIPNLNDLPNDLTIPAISEGPPAAGKRVRQLTVGYENGNLYHILYLPIDWKPGGKYPLVIEYPGNGGYTNKYGDRSTGRMEDCKLGFGVTAGMGCIWVCLPFVDPIKNQHSLNWWGDADVTADYCRTTVEQVCTAFGGDRDRLVLAGFSRGAIACNYIGMRNDEIAKLWRGMISHSHYDGVRRWGYAADDPDSARARAARFQGKPQFISHELSTDDTQLFLKDSKIKATFLSLPFPNHCDTWVLKDLPERRKLREWFAELIKE